MGNEKNSIEVIARVFIVDGDEVLLCKGKGNDNYFFPGGHVEYGEKVEDALKRELQEEIAARLTDLKFWGVCENSYVGDGQWQGDSMIQEINLVFEGRVERKDYQALEGWMEFGWFPIGEVPKMNVLPESLKEEFLRWTEKKETFFLS